MAILLKKLANPFKKIAFSLISLHPHYDCKDYPDTATSLISKAASRCCQKEEKGKSPS
ncbi:hypothetical protein [Prevotella sp.]|jgi:hypothetical protein|uniref:hypothetical protein n=1 Tax=Prevotella sp. TaxID=59823 RepID=UPI003AB99949